MDPNIYKKYKQKNARPLLEFKNVTVIKNDNKKILDSVSVTIWQGEDIAILGPNGAGKSSFIKMITREYYPTIQGEGSSLKIWGEDRWNVADLRFLLGIVSNDLQYACTREITGLELVLSGFFSSIGLYNQHVTQAMKKKAQSILEFMEIIHLKDRKMTEMSSGEAKRFLISRALAHDPKALILDEPGTSLDLHALHKLGNILRKISKSGISIILVTQNIQEIIPEIGRVVLIKGGKIYKDGPKGSILTRENMNRLFDASVDVIERDGYYYALRAC